jgi:RimJ/RimL family protein N-acetyltransferase
MFRQEKVCLTPFTWEQAQQYLDWVNQEEIAHWLTRSLPVTPLQHQRWYEALIQRSDAVVFSVLDNHTSEYLGNVWLWGVHNIHRSAELRILLGPHAKGKGFGGDAVRGLLRFAFQDLNLNKVYLYVLANNVAAVKTFEKAGFSCEGSLREEFFVAGKYQDALRMAVHRG